LEKFYDLVVPNGIIAFNGFGQVPHEGEGKALDEFIQNRGLKPKFKRFSFSSMPTVYFKKCWEVSILILLSLLLFNSYTSVSFASF